MMRLAPTLLLVLFLLTACDNTSDEEQITENIAAIETAVEEKDFSAIAKYLDSSFVANDHMEIEEVERLLRLYSLQHKRINVTIVGSTTTMHANFSDQADSVVSVIATGSSGLLPSDGSIRRVEVEWIKDSNDWLIRKASWRH